MLRASSFVCFIALGAMACGEPNTQPPGTDGGPDGSTDGSTFIPLRIDVTPTSALSLVEGGAPGTFSIALADAPTADVVIAITTSDATAAIVSPSSVTFTPENHATAQVITVTPTDDTTEDGPQSFTVRIGAAVSADPRYAGLDATDVAGTTADDDLAGFIVSAVEGSLSEAGSTATFTVRLTRAPTSNVALAVTSSDPTEGTVAPAGLVFTPESFATPQTVTLTSADDDFVDGIVAWTVVLAAAVSGDARYQGLDAADVAVATADDDEAGATHSTPAPLRDLTASTTTFTLVLDTRPSADVTFPLSLANATIAVGSSTVTFTPANWDVPQPVTVTWAGTNVTADTTATVVIGLPTTTDPWYTVVDPADVIVPIEDAANEDVLVTAVGGGTSFSFTVALTQPPVGDVTISLSTEEDELSLSPSSLTFTSASFATRQTVTLSGDGVTDGTASYDVVLTPSSEDDDAYDSLDPLHFATRNSGGHSVWALAAGLSHTCALVNGGVQCWGFNGNGQLGNDSTDQSETPVAALGLASGVQSLAAGDAHTCAVASDRAYCWGQNYSGQLGDNTTDERHVPVEVISSGVQAIAAGSEHTCALVNGGVLCWGSNSFGQLGDPEVTRSFGPRAVPGLTSGVQAISAGMAHTCALTSGGVQCWGGIDYTPTPVMGLPTDVHALVTGGVRSCALGGGDLWCWNPGETPTRFDSIAAGVQAIALSYEHSCTLVGRRFHCWGENGHGQLGNDSTTDSEAPVLVSDLMSGTLGVPHALGASHACAVVDDGVWCWGFNSVGQLGNPVADESHVPVRVGAWSFEED